MFTMMMMSTIIPQVFTNLTTPKTNSYSYSTNFKKPTNFYVCCYNQRSFRLGFESGHRLLSDKKKRVVLVRLNNLKFNGGGGGGGGKDDGGTAKMLGNVALAVGLTYLTLTGQLGWILDTIVSIWVCTSLYSLQNIAYGRTSKFVKLYKKHNLCKLWICHILSLGRGVWTHKCCWLS